MISKRFRRGLAISIEGVPDQTTVSAVPISRVAFYGPDFRGLRPDVLVEEHERVFVGTALFSDRKRPEIKVTSPVSGRVSEISIGSRRRLASITVQVEGEEPIEFDTASMSHRELLLESGLLARMTARPFGSVPDPARTPEALFVSAMDTAPGAADPGPIVRNQAEAFGRGLDALADLTDGPVYVCFDDVGPDIPELGRARPVKISGLHPAGLSGTQIDLVQPLRGGAEVWQIQAQDVIAFGDLLATGAVSGKRIVALSGPGVKNPRLVQVPMGAHVAEMMADNVAEGRWKALSGPAIGGVESAALRRDHLQVSVVPRVEPGVGRLRRLLPTPTRPPKPEAFVPTRAIDLALGPDIPVVPLLRALSVGDVETADRLGVRALLEEDMALVTYASGGKQDFGILLRRVLDQIEEAA